MNVTILLNNKIQNFTVDSQNSKQCNGFIV